MDSLPPRREWLHRLAVPAYSLIDARWADGCIRRAASTTRAEAASCSRIRKAYTRTILVGRFLTKEHSRGHVLNPPRSRRAVCPRNTSANTWSDCRCRWPSSTTGRTTPRTPAPVRQHVLSLRGPDQARRRPGDRVLSPRGRQGAPRSKALDRVLAQLALPSLGQWVGMLRELARHFGQRPDAASHPLGHLWDQLDDVRRDRPALLALYRRIKHGADGQPGGRPELFAASGIRRPGAVSQRRLRPRGRSVRRRSTTERDGAAALPGRQRDARRGDFRPARPAREPAGLRHAELRQLDEDRVEVGLRELVGKDGERACPVGAGPFRRPPRSPDRVAVALAGPAGPAAARPAACSTARASGRATCCSSTATSTAGRSST